MRLVIKLDKKYNTESFIQNWLKKAISIYLRAEINKNKKLITYHFSNNVYDVYKNLMYATKFIDIKHLQEGSSDVLIEINPNRFNLENTAKLYDICAMVNFGSLSNPACPIFTKTFDYFAKNFWTLYRDYEWGILPCL